MIWWLQWAVQDTFIFKAITPSILVQFSKYWWPNTSVFKTFLLMCRTPTWHVPTCLTTCPKVGPWKLKITKIYFPSECQQMLGRNLNLHKKPQPLSIKRCHITSELMEKNDLKGLTSLGQYLIFLLIWVLLEYGNFWGQTIRSFWDAASQNRTRNVGVITLWNTQGFWTFNLIHFWGD